MERFIRAKKPLMEALDTIKAQEDELLLAIQNIKNKISYEQNKLEIAQEDLNLTLCKRDEYVSAREELDDIKDEFTKLYSDEIAN